MNCLWHDATAIALAVHLPLIHIASAHGLIRQVLACRWMRQPPGRLCEVAAGGSDAVAWHALLIPGVVRFSTSVAMHSLKCHCAHSVTVLGWMLQKRHARIPTCHGRTLQLMEAIHHAAGRGRRGCPCALCRRACEHPWKAPGTVAAANHSRSGAAAVARRWPRYALPCLPVRPNKASLQPADCMHSTAAPCNCWWASSYAMTD